MTLTLRILNASTLKNGGPTSVRLERHGLTIGRSPHMDWSLPDSQAYISSSHCEIRYRDGAYFLHDNSTNGTYLKGSGERLKGPHPLADGEVLLVGQYEIAVQDGAAAIPVATKPEAPQSAFTWGEPAPAPALDAWGASPASTAPGSWDTPSSPSGWGDRAASAPGWGASPEPSTPPPAAPAGPASWSDVAAKPFAEEAGGLSNHWAAPSVAAVQTPGAGVAASPWDSPAPSSGPAPSAWSAPISAAPAAPAAADIWGSLSDVNAVDWNRGGFDRPPAAAPLPTATAAASAPSPSAWAAPASGSGGVAAWGDTGARTEPVAVAPSPPPASLAGTTGAVASFLAGAGLKPGDLKGSDGQSLAAAGDVLRRLVGGLVVLLEARMRAKAQMGAQGTLLEFSGNNPLKFARSPEQAIAQLINPPERGFMPAGQAIEDSFRDLQAHQMATLAAMQGALAATLKRFSPTAIRGRAENRGVLAKILPAAREAALWQAYEREFEGVAQGSDEAFMDIFAKEFRTAYEAAAAGLKAKE